MSPGERSWIRFLEKHTLALWASGSVVPIKKSVLIETVEFVQPRCVGYESHV
jgi:hypothetical protein